MRKARLLAAVIGLSLCMGAGVAVAAEGILYPYSGLYPRSHPDRWSYVRTNPYKRYPQSTYRWDAQRQTWYYAGPNWRYWNPMKPMANPIIVDPNWPPVPSGIYVEPR